MVRSRSKARSTVRRVLKAAPRRYLIRSKTKTYRDFEITDNGLGYFVDNVMAVLKIILKPKMSVEVDLLCSLGQCPHELQVALEQDMLIAVNRFQIGLWFELKSRPHSSIVYLHNPVMDVLLHPNDGVYR